MKKLDHWAWGQPLSEFYPLGEEKLSRLATWIYNHASNPLQDQVAIVDRLQKDRRAASQVYTVFKNEVENCGCHAIKQNETAKSKKAKVKKAKSKKTKKKAESVSNVIDFAAYKQSRAS